MKIKERELSTSSDEPIENINSYLTGDNGDPVVYIEATYPE